PHSATYVSRKSQPTRADNPPHIPDEPPPGTDTVATARVLTAAIKRIENVDLVIAGNEASDGRGGAVPAMIAELPGLPQVTFVRNLTGNGASVTGERETAEGVTDR